MTEIPGLSCAQERFWLVHQFHPAPTDFYVSATLLLDSMDPEAVERSLNAAVGRHEILRSVFPSNGGKPHPTIRSPESAAVRVTLFDEPFDIAIGPLFHARLYRSDSGMPGLQVRAHRMVADRYSLLLIFDEILHGCVVPGPPYSEFVRAQRGCAGSSIFREAMAFWHEQHHGKPHVFELRPDRGRGSISSFRVASRPLSLIGLASAKSTEQFLLAAVTAVLGRQSGQEDVLIGVVDESWRMAYPNTIGPFENILPLRLNFDEEQTFQQLADQIVAKVAAARRYAAVPFEKVIENLSIERRLGRPPLVQIAFRLDTMIHGRPQPEFHSSGDAGFDLTFCFSETDGRLRGAIQYDPCLFDPATIARLAGHIETIVEDAAARPDCRVSELALLTASERDEQLGTWNATAADYPEHACIHELFERQAARTPEAVAAVFGQAELTYAELNRRANRLAHYLIDSGVGPEMCVGIALERSFDSLIAPLAVLKAGAAYVPLDPAHPAARLAFIAEDAGLQTFIKRNGGIDPDAHAPEIALQPDANPEVRAGIENLAYVIYTSGSTGRPKGVQITHRGIGNMILAQIRILGLRPEDRVLQFASMNFDAAVYEIFITLLAGATLCLAEEADLLPGRPLSETMRRQRITVLVQPPSLLSAMKPEDVPALRVLVAAGEACSADLVRQWAPGRRMFNAYGPTEATVCATIGECVPGNEDPHIGKPIANTRIRILSPALHLVPVGTPGEIFIGGPGLARGYLHRAALTAEKFIADPFAPGSRLYRTGDAGAYLPDGNIQFLGRMDHQIKIRGFRIEQNEIEAVLREHSGVGQAVVIAREDRPGEKKLIAYITASRSNSSTSADELRSHAETYLPHYMIPSAFVQMDSLPLLPSGKVDRGSLPAPGRERREKATQYVEPGTPLEQSLAKIWCDLLGLETIGINDHFFHIGGESLLANQAVARIRQELNIDVPLRSIFDYPTIAGLAGSIIESLTSMADAQDMAALLAEVENGFDDRG